MVVLNDNVNFDILDDYGFMDVAEDYYEISIIQKDASDRISINKNTRQITYNDTNNVDKLLEFDVIKKMLNNNIITIQK